MLLALAPWSPPDCSNGGGLSFALQLWPKAEPVVMQQEDKDPLVMKGAAWLSYLGKVVEMENG